MSILELEELLSSGSRDPVRNAHFRAARRQGFYTQVMPGSRVLGEDGECRDKAAEARCVFSCPPVAGPQEGGATGSGGALDSSQGLQEGDQSLGLSGNILRRSCSVILSSLELGQQLGQFHFLLPLALLAPNPQSDLGTASLLGEVERSSAGDSRDRQEQTT